MRIFRRSGWSGFLELVDIADGPPASEHAKNQPDKQSGRGDHSAPVATEPSSGTVHEVFALHDSAFYIQEKSRQGVRRWRYGVLTMIRCSLTTTKSYQDMARGKGWGLAWGTALSIVCLGARHHIADENRMCTSGWLSSSTRAKIYFESKKTIRGIYLQRLPSSLQKRHPTLGSRL